MSSSGDAVHLLDQSGLEYAAENQLAVLTLPPSAAVALFGALAGRPAKYYNILGGRSLGWNSTAVLGDCCDYLDTTQDLMNTPTAGQTLYLRSTSNNDKAGGPGAVSVRTVYLDANGAQQVRDDTLTGTTQLSVGTGYSAIQWMEVKTTTGAEVAAGDITLSSINGVATVATTFERIAAGGNRSLSGRYKVPAGYSAYVLEWNAAAISATMDTRFRGDWFADDGVLTAGVYHFKDRVFLASGQNAAMDLHYLRAPAGATLKVSAVPGSAPAGNKLDVNIDLLLVQD